MSRTTRGPDRDRTVGHRAHRRLHGHWRRIGVVATAAIASIALVIVPTPAGASEHNRAPSTLAEGFAGPLSIDVTHRGDVLVGQSFSGVLSSVDRRGQVTDVTAEPGLEAVAEGPFGSTLYTVSDQDAGVALLKIRTPRGKTWTLADLHAYEASHNPDGSQSYGVSGITDECAAQWPTDELGPPQYDGIVDSHPYALAVVPWGVYVADAAANAILLVGWTGHVSTVSVLPPQPLELSQGAVDALGLPQCVVDHTYNFEAVPTDIELSWTGAYVSLLPGGPEYPSAGARGSVVKLNLFNGNTRTVAQGLAGATDLAVSPWGQIYVTELFANRVSKVTRKGVEPVADLTSPAAIEWSRGRLYVAHDVFANGTISTMRG